MGSQDDINVGHMTFPGTSYNFCNFLVEMPKFILFASMIAFQKWWKMLFILS